MPLRSRSLVVAVVTIILLATIAAVQVEGSGCTVEDQIKRDGPWTSIKAPEFTRGPAKLSAYAVHPTDPSIMWVTNGKMIMRSVDRGCRWATVFPDGNVAAADEALEETITGLVVPHSHEGSPIVATLESPVRQAPLTKGDPAPPGYGLIISDDLGDSWRPATGGLPPTLAGIYAVAVAPSDHRVIYLLASSVTGKLPSTDLSPALYATRDGGKSWTLVSDDPTGGADPQAWSLEVHPDRPQTLWLAGSGVARSTDGGETWVRVELGSSVAGIDVSRGGAHTAAALDTGVVVSEDGGDSWQDQGSPGFVRSVAFGPSSGDIALSAGTPGAGTAWIRQDDGSWADESHHQFEGQRRDYVQVSADLRKSFYWIDVIANSLERYDIPSEEPMQLAPAPESATNVCSGGAAPPTVDEVEPNPPNMADIYVSNFDTGCIVRFDRFGNATVAARGRENSEGVAFDHLGRVVIATRFTNLVTRFDPDVGKISNLALIRTNESPAFDRYGTLYINDNNENDIYALPWPQVPHLFGQNAKPRLIADFRSIREGDETNEFLEDMRIAPDTSPFAGDLFVQYYRQAPGSEDANGEDPEDEEEEQQQAGAPSGNPNAIARFTQLKDGSWQREKDFARLPEQYESLGMSFKPDGSLLVIPFITDDKTKWQDNPLLEYSPDGSEWRVFGRAPGAGCLLKGEVTPEGYVFATRYVFAPGCADSPVRNGDRSAEDPSTVTDREPVLLRFAPDGRRLFPDFTAGLTSPVGVATANVITGLPLLDPVVPPEIPVVLGEPQSPVAIAAAPPAPPPPPPPPALVPPVVPVVNPAPAPGNAPANAPAQASAAQPQAGLVRQQQTQPQMAFVTAARSVEANVATEHAMTALRTRLRHPLEGAATGLGAASMALLLAWGIGFAKIQHVTARVRGNRRRC